MRRFLYLKYQDLHNSFAACKLIWFKDFAHYQEGPGIRNWQYVTANGVKFINIRCINDDTLSLENANMISTQEAYLTYKHFLVKEKDILVSTSGSLGRFAIARKKHLPLCMNTSVIRFMPKIPENYSYLFSYLMSDEFKNLITSMANGSAQLNFGPTHIQKIKINIPDDESIKKFSNETNPIIDSYLRYLDKIDVLTTLKQKFLEKYF